MIRTYDIQHTWINKKGNNSLGLKLILFFIWPFGAWLYSLCDANKRSSYIIFFLFSLLLCWHMSPNITEGFYDDFLGILERFKNTDFTYQEISTQIRDYFTFSNNAPKELYENIIICFVKSITDNYHFYFLLCSIPVAYCQLNSLKRITQDIRFQPKKWLAIVMVIMFLFPRDIITVQNPRFTTGFWICILTSLNYFCAEKKHLIKLLPIMLTPLIHSGMWLYIMIIISYLFIPKRIKIFEIIALCTIPFSFIDSEFIRNIDLGLFLPDSLYQWSLNHYNPNEIVQDMRAGYWWVGAGFGLLVKFMYIYMTYIIIKHRSEVYQNYESKNFYLFFLFLFSIVNMIQGIPVLGERYFWFIKIFVIFIWFKTFYLRHKNVLICLLLANSWAFITRYGYVLGGALSVNTPIDIFFTPLPYLMGKGLLW